MRVRVERRSRIAVNCGRFTLKRQCQRGVSIRHQWPEVRLRNAPQHDLGNDALRPLRFHRAKRIVQQFHSRAIRTARRPRRKCLERFRQHDGDARIAFGNERQRFGARNDSRLDAVARQHRVRELGHVRRIRFDDEEER